MTRLRLVAAVAFVVLLPAGSAQAASPVKRCTAKGSRTVVKTKFARVYTAKNAKRADEVARLYGCLNSTGRRTLLDTSRDDGFGTTVKFSQVAVSGRFVTWEHVVRDVSCRAACPPDYDPTSEVIIRTDLRSRKSKAIEGNPRAGTLKVDSRGTVTWVDTDTGEPRSDPAKVAAARAKSCTANGAKTVVKSKSGRVFTTPGRPGDDTIDRLFGCLYSNGKRVLLDESTDDDYVSSHLFSEVKLNGRFVAWQVKDEDFSCKADCPPGYDPTTESVVLVDLRTRKRKSTAGEARRGTLAVTRGGTASWLDATTGEPRSAALR